MDISRFVEPAVFVICLLAGPPVVGRLIPERTGVQGSALAGQSGMSPMFWGTPAGLVAAAAILMIVDPPTVYLTESERFQNTSLLFLILLVLSAPLLLWGADMWVWDAQGLEFRGVFRRKKVMWSEIVKVAPGHERGCSIATAQGVVLRTSQWVSGNALIIQALHHYRPSAFV